MGKTTRKSETVYVDPERYEQIVQLANTTRIPRAVLWREALDDLLRKHGVLKEVRKKP